MQKNGFHPVRFIRQYVIRQFARLLTKPLKNYTPRFPNNVDFLKRALRKGDIILVEGEQRISEVIKYLTQSSWSHAALYVGDELMRRPHAQAGQLRAAFGEEANFLLIEALVESGVVASPLSKYIHFNIRVCRPHNLRKDHLQLILDDVISSATPTTCRTCSIWRDIFSRLVLSRDVSAAKRSNSAAVCPRRSSAPA